jgi:putative transposase
MRHTTFRFALDPTPAQEQMLAWHAGASRFAYNECLRFVTNALDAKRKDPSVKVPWSGYDLINAFNAWKRGEEAGRVFVVATDGVISKQVTGLAWRQKVSAQVFEEAAVDLGRSLAAYGRAKQGAHGGRRFGFPRRKRKGRCRDSFRLRNKRQSGGYLIRVGDGPLRSVTLPTIGRVRVHDDTRRLRQLLRPRAQIDPATGEEQVAPRAKILFATIARRGTRWYVSLNVHATDLHPGRGHQPCPEREAGGYVGVDVGLVAFAVAARSDGTEVGRWQANNPLSCRLRRLQRSSRSLSRAQRGSRNHGKAARRLRREHARVADARRSFLHEVSSHLVKNHALLAVEDLAVHNLVRHNRLARAIGDAALVRVRPSARLQGRVVGGGSRGVRPLVRVKSDLLWVRHHQGANEAGRAGVPLRCLRPHHGQRSQRRRQSRRLGRACPGPGPPSGRPGHQCLWRGRRWPLA